MAVAAEAKGLSAEAAAAASAAVGAEAAVEGEAATAESEPAWARRCRSTQRSNAAGPAACTGTWSSPPHRTSTRKPVC